tara:strand:+ start:594 stop:1700 length:1107 start_codon:yes stop_codon:yes gene_type:complete
MSQNNYNWQQLMQQVAQQNAAKQTPFLPTNQQAAPPPTSLFDKSQYSRFGNAMARGGGFGPMLNNSALQQQITTPDQLEMYNQARKAARNKGLGQMMYALSDAFGGRDIGKGVQERQLAQSGGNATTFQKDYQFLVRQGYSPQDAINLLKQRTSTNINMNQNSNKLWDFSLDNLKKDMDAIGEQKQLIDKVKPAHELLLSGDVETGYFQEKILPAKQVFNSLGITTDENLGEQEFVLATTKFLVPRMREKGSGSTSDFEAQLFEQAAPSFGKSTEGNLILMGTWLQTAERDAELVALKEDYILGNSGNVFGFDKYLDQLAQEGKEPKIYERFGSPNDVVTAFENKQIKDGEVIIMNGKLIVFRKDDII